MTDQKRIAKNAIALFCRTFITIGISLYISRRLLLILGESDFGIYSVVGGIAVTFNFLESAIFSGAQRFLALSLKENIQNYRQCFTTCLNVYIALCIIIFCLCETFGLYIINNVLNIPPERMWAANWVFQLSILTVIITLTNGPFKASIIVNERLSYFAKIDVAIKLLQLTLIIGLAFISWDHLIFYSAAMMLIALTRAIIDKIYCYHQFNGCRYIRFFDKHQFKSLLSFAGWTFFKSASESGVNQGNNILVNVFGGTIASASLGLGNQIWGTVAGFVNNIHLAYTSQIIQNWGLGYSEVFSRLITDSMRYSYYMLIIIGVPFLTNTEFILKIWLDDIPNYAIHFCQLCFISSVLYSIINPINIGVQATGKIKKFQLMGSIILLFDIPAAYLLLKLGSLLIFVLIVRILFQGVLLIYNSIYLSSISSFPTKLYLVEIIRNTLIAMAGCSISIAISSLINISPFINFILIATIGLAVTIVLIWLFSLKTVEKELIIVYLKNFIH